MQYTGHRESAYVKLNVTHFSHGSLNTLASLEELFLSQKMIFIGYY